MNLSPTRHLPLLAFLLAASPMAVWYGRRITDQSDEPLGLIALIAAVFFLIQERKQTSLNPTPLLIGAMVLSVLHVFGLASFPLLLGLLVVVTIACAIQMSNRKAGIIALLILSLPLMASLDFFAGYPLRLVAAEAARVLLSFMGLEIMRAGALLKDGLNLIGVDPPCAGIRMLWTGWFVAAVLAAKTRLDGKRTLALLTGTLAIVVLGNSLRAVILFFPESGRVHWAHWTHEAVGLFMHALVLIAIFSLSSRLHQARPRIRKAPINQPKPLRLRPSAAGWPAIAVVLLCGIIAHAKIVRPQPAIADEKQTTAWPTTLDGVPLVLLPLTERERRFAEAFPGDLARFRCGDADVILRRVTRPTRLLHSSADCLSASGYIVEHEPVTQDTDGRIWGAFRASGHGNRLLVRERITSRDETTESTDVSAWFWQAAFHPSEGPWLAVTVMERRD